METMDSFGISRAAAFAVDGCGYKTIEYPCSPQDADAMFDVLTYEKAHRLLRMLNSTLDRRSSATGSAHSLHAHPMGMRHERSLVSLREDRQTPCAELMDGWISNQGSLDHR